MILSAVNVPRGVTVGIDAVELQGMVDTTTDEEWAFVFILLAALFSAAVTCLATSDAVRQHVRPEECARHKEADDRRRKRQNRRRSVERALEEAARPRLDQKRFQRFFWSNPLQHINLPALHAAIEFAEQVQEEVGISVEVIDAACQIMHNAAQLQAQAALRCGLAEVHLNGILESARCLLKLDTATLDAALDEAKLAGVPRSLLDRAVETLQRATRLQRKRDLALERLQLATADPAEALAATGELEKELKELKLTKSEMNAIDVGVLTNATEKVLRIDTAELEAALLDARQALVEDRILTPAEKLLDHAVRAQRKQSLGSTASVLGRLRAKIVRRKRAESAAERLALAHRASKQALEALERSRRVDLLYIAADELSDALDFARAARVPIPNDCVANLKALSSASQEWLTAGERLAQAHQHGEAILIQLPLFTDSQLITALKDLQECVIRAHNAYADEESLLFANSVHRALSKSLKSRQTGAKRLEAAITRLEATQVACADYSSASSLGVKELGLEEPDIEERLHDSALAIAAAQKAGVYEAPVAAAVRIHDRRADEKALVDKMESARFAMQRLDAEGSDDDGHLRDAIAALSSAIETSHAKYLDRSFDGSAWSMGTTRPTNGIAPCFCWGNRAMPSSSKTDGAISAETAKVMQELEASALNVLNEASTMLVRHNEALDRLIFATFEAHQTLTDIDDRIYSRPPGAFEQAIEELHLAVQSAEAAHVPPTLLRNTKVILNSLSAAADAMHVA